MYLYIIYLLLFFILKNIILFLIDRDLWERVNIDGYNYNVFFNAIKCTNIKNCAADYNKCIQYIKSTTHSSHDSHHVITTKGEPSRKTLCDNITTIADKSNNTNLILKRF